jgi:hypothetical protein
MSEMSLSEKKKEDWMNSKWRPMMGWMYMVVCICDFVLFPILWSLIQALHGGRVETQWSPITLNGAGLFHMAMGAILGIAAYGRTQEKMAGANNGGAQTTTPASSFTAPSTFPTGFGATSGFGDPATSVASAPSSFGSSSGVGTSAAKPTVGLSTSGKLMPAQPVQPEI